MTAIDTAPAAAPATSVPRRRRPGGAMGRGLLGLGIFVLVLELLPRTGLVDRAFLPPASAMLGALADQATSGAFWVALLQTIRGWALGLAIASLAGVTLGVVIGSVELLRRGTATTIEFLRPIPSVALIPLALLLFGTDMRSTLLLVVYAAFWQVLVQVLYGVQDVDPVARETARSYGLRRITQVRRVTWPTALPFVLTGFRLAASVALILQITGELIIGTPGIGRQIGVAQSSGAVETMYALVVVTGLLGVSMNLLARAAERRLLAWHPSVRGEGSWAP